jgi:phosphatidate cytidylyltransferase
MPFNIQVFKTRALTALIFVAVMLVGLLINYWLFLILFLIINVGCWIEYFRIVGKINNSYSKLNWLHKTLALSAGIGLILYFFYTELRNVNYLIHQVAWWVLGIFAVFFPITQVVLNKHNKKQAIQHAFYSIAGLMYISLSLGLLVNMRCSPNNTNFGFVIPLILIASIWINDTMAYIVGSFIGKTPFSSISPKKTWEGTIGGALLCVLVIGFIVAPLLTQKPVGTFTIHWFVIAAIAAVFGTLGDLLESKLKRLANVKDSGNFMPGHGGFLDRFDSLLMATPFVWLYLHFFL